MATLPHTDTWSPELVDARLSFLEAAAMWQPRPESEAVEDRRTAVGTSDVVRDPRALVVAADLALATDRTARGLDLMRRAVVGILRRSEDKIAASLPGAIVGHVSTALASESVLLRIAVHRGGVVTDQTLTAPYPALTPHGLSLMADVLCACVASASPLHAFQLERHSGQPGPKLLIVRTLAGTEPVASVLSAFGVFFDDGTLHVEPNRRDDILAASALAAMTLHWSGTLALLHADRHHWNEARARSPLIDLRRLAIELGLRRWQRRSELPRPLRERPDTLPGALDRFITDLADEIEAARPRA